MLIIFITDKGILTRVFFYLFYIMDYKYVNIITSYQETGRKQT